MSDVGAEGNISERNGGPNINAVEDSTLNQAFDLLRSQRRRYVLQTLYTTAEGVVSVDDLADHVLAHDPDASDRDRVRVHLYHQTLPRLMDDGVIDVDSRTNTVRYHGSEVVDNLLAALAE